MTILAAFLAGILTGAACLMLWARRRGAEVRARLVADLAEEVQGPDPRTWYTFPDNTTVPTRGFSRLPVNMNRREN